MRKIYPYVVIILLCVFSGVVGSATSLDVQVPARSAGLPIKELELFVDLPPTTPGSVEVTITRTSNTAVSQSQIINVDPGGSGGTNPTLDFSDDVGSTPGHTDAVSLTKNPPNTTPADTVHRRVKVHVELESNYIHDPASNPPDWSCGIRQPAAETWTFSATTTGSTPVPVDIIGACVNSYEVQPGSTNCGRLLMPDSTTPNQEPAHITTTASLPMITPCEDARPPVQAMLVLDKSGSMSSAVTGSVPSKTKIEALQDTVRQFVTVWESITTNTNDKLGVVLFNHDPQDWPVITPGLNSFDSALASTVKSNVTSITAGGATSIGDGLETAANHINLQASTDARRVILLLTDGKQNWERWVATDPATHDVYTHNSDFSGRQSLPGLDKLNIWSVGVGHEGTDVNPAILQQIAATGLGFYINSEVSADELNLFFLELLQNFLRFNTVETTSLVNDTIPITQMGSGSVGHKQLKVATTSTAKSVSFTLMWDKSKEANVSMQIKPPMGDPIDGEALERGPGYIHFASKLPLGESYPKNAQTGEWAIDIGVQGSHVSNPFPFQFFSLADDDIVKAKFSIAKKDYVTGDAIPLQVKLSEFRKPLNNTNGNVTVMANLVKPETGIGNILANAQVTPGEADSGADPQSAVQQKLQALLNENANLFKHVSNSVQLFDDGLAMHGDEKANDGIFSTLYTQTETQGNYSFLFTVNGATNASGPINRQHLETIYVRLQPDPSSSELTVARVSDADKPYFNVTMTPRDRFGNLMGPGYANYFVLAPVNGSQYKFEDKDLNGVYSVKIPANGNQQAPDLNISYVEPFIHVTDAMYPDKIPANLIKPFPVNGGRSRSMSFHIGVDVPHGTLKQYFDGKEAFAIDYEQQWRGLNSLLFFAGSNSFSGTSSNVDISNISFNLKRYNQAAQNRVLRFFGNIGLGYYFANPGDDDVGINAGGGLSYPLNSIYELDAWYNYHHIFSSPDTTDFSTIQLGLHYHF